MCVCGPLCCMAVYTHHQVDREERPDVDKVYMTFIQASQGGGGWPMSVFLTPELEPFMGGTYFPPEDHFGRPGFPTVLKAIAKQVSMRRVRRKNLVQSAFFSLTVNNLFFSVGKG